MKFLVKQYYMSRVEFKVVDEQEYKRLTRDANRYGYKLKIVSNPEQNLPSVVQTI